MTALCVVSPGSLGVDGDRVQLSPKALEGLVKYASTWPGQVVFIARPARTCTASIGFDWPRLSELPIDVVVAEDPDIAMRSLGSRRIALVPLDVENKHMTHTGTAVLVCDYPIRVRWEAARVDPSCGTRQTIRMGLGLARRLPTLRAMSRRAAGLQCNGPDAFSAYGKLNRDSIEFYDTRVTDLELAQARASPTSRAVGMPLRLAFSGRWIYQKDPLSAVRLTNRLIAQGHDVSLSLYGGGPLETILREHASTAVQLVGRLDFHNEWVPTVTDNVDLMVLPHPQSDSASTYLESMSCGAPVIASNNRYWEQFLAVHGAGWGVAVNDVNALTVAVSRLAENPSEIERHRARGLNWASDHTFEREFERRVDHLRRIAQV